MSDMVSFNVVYDRDSDVLYLSSRRAPASKGTTDEYGIVWRYDETGSVISATVLDFGDYWTDHMTLLARELSKKFDVPKRQMETVLDHAIKDEKG